MLKIFPEIVIYIVTSQQYELALQVENCVEGIFF
jgi:hypothetical protein